MSEQIETSTKTTPKKFIERLPKNPKEIPGAKSIEVMIDAPSPKHCLIHVRQAHFSKMTAFGGPIMQKPLEDFNSSDEWQHERDTEFRQMFGNLHEECALVIAVQTNIHTILSHLSHLGATHLLNEGTTEKADGTVDNPEEDLRDLKNKYRKHSGHVWRYSKEIWKSDTDKRLDELRKKILERQAESDTILEGARDIIRNKKMILHAGEDPTLNKEAHEANSEHSNLKTDQTKARFDQAQEKRKEFVLKQIASKNLPIAVVKFGGGDDFQPTVKQWNIDNPDDQISLIIITPETFIEESELKRRALSKKSNDPN